MYYWLLKRVLAEPLFRIWWRPWVEGAENVPQHGPVILVSNHIGEGETLLLPVLMKRRVAFLAKAELFQGTGLKGTALKWFLRSIRMTPLDRSGGQASAAGLAAFGEFVRRGRILIVFPEGGRSPDGRLYRGRTGAARLALQYDLPVVPVAVSHTKMGKGRLGLPRLVRPGVRFGKPMTFPEYSGAGNDRDILRWVTDEVMNEVMQLSGQTYVDAYSSAVKAGERTGRQVEAPVLPRPGHGRTAPPVPIRNREAA